MADNNIIGRRDLASVVIQPEGENGKMLPERLAGTEVHVDAGESDDAPVHVRLVTREGLAYRFTFANGQDFRDWANTDERSRPEVGPHGDVFELVRQAIDVTGTGDKMVVTGESAEGRGGAFAVKTRVSTLLDQDRSNLRQEQAGLIEAGFLAPVDVAGRPTMTGTEDEALLAARDRLRGFLTQAGVENSRQTPEHLRSYLDDVRAMQTELRGALNRRDLVASATLEGAASPTYTWANAFENWLVGHRLTTFTVPTLEGDQGARVVQLAPELSSMADFMREAKGSTQAPAPRAYSIADAEKLRASDAGGFALYVSYLERFGSSPDERELATKLCEQAARRLAALANGDEDRQAAELVQRLMATRPGVAGRVAGRALELIGGGDADSDDFLHAVLTPKTLGQFDFVGGFVGAQGSEVRARRMEQVGEALLSGNVTDKDRQLHRLLTRAVDRAL